MKTFSHTRPVRDEAGTITGEKLSPAVRVTVAPMASYGPDGRRRLVVSLKAGDVIEFRPERSPVSKAITAKALDLYKYLLRHAASVKALEKARNKKAAKQARRLAERIRRADAKLKRELRAERGE